MPELTSEQRQQIIAALQAGRKLEAIRLFRDASGADLRDAKTFIEHLKNTLATGEVPAIEAAGLDEQIVAMLKDKQRLPAIKAYCDATGVGLKDGKDAVEAIAREHGIEFATGSGCGSAVLMLIVLCGIFVSLAA